MIYWEEYGRKWGREAAKELHSLEEALSRKNRKERTDGGSQGSERRGTVGTCWQLRSSQPWPSLGTTIGRWILIILQLASWSGWVKSEDYPKFPSSDYKSNLLLQGFPRAALEELESPHWVSAPWCPGLPSREVVLEVK